MPRPIRRRRVPIPQWAIDLTVVALQAARPTQRPSPPARVVSLAPARRRRQALEQGGVYAKP